MLSGGEVMSKIKASLFATSILLIISGCSSNQYAVTYDTNPKGAQLYCNGVPQGYTPKTLYYTLTEQNKKNGVLNTVPCGVKWVSGVTSKADSYFNLTQFPNGVITTTPRPNAPDAHIDHSFALQLQQNQQMNQVLYNQQQMQNEQQRVKNEKQQEDNTQALCNLGLLTYGCKK